MDAGFRNVPQDAPGSRPQKGRADGIQSGLPLPPALHRGRGRILLPRQAGTQLLQEPPGEFRGQGIPHQLPCRRGLGGAHLPVSAGPSRGRRLRHIRDPQPRHHRPGGCLRIQARQDAAPLHRPLQRDGVRGGDEAGARAAPARKGRWYPDHRSQLHGHLLPRHGHQLRTGLPHGAGWGGRDLPERRQRVRDRVPRRQPRPSIQQGCQLRQRS